MPSKKLIVGVVIVGVAVIVAIGFAAKYNTNGDKMDSKDTATTMMQKENDETNEAMMKKDEKAKEDAAMMKKESDQMMANGTTTQNKMMNKEDSMMAKESPSTYIDYSAQALTDAENAQKIGRRVVLFFHATWCPFCQAADKDFKATIGTSAFPQNTTLIKVDYDSQVALKKQYSITSQHTFVQIDANGNQITKWVSGETAELKANIK